MIWGLVILGEEGESKNPAAATTVVTIYLIMGGTAVAKVVAAAAIIHTAAVVPRVAKSMEPMAKDTMVTTMMMIMVVVAVAVMVVIPCHHKPHSQQCRKTHRHPPQRLHPQHFHRRYHSSRHPPQLRRTKRKYQQIHPTVVVLDQHQHRDLKLLLQLQPMSHRHPIGIVSSTEMACLVLKLGWQKSFRLPMSSLSLVLPPRNNKYP
mmetsp:Transcript_44692/g.107806  ORF Transcript_44692/g.107806 Transcript_44692/m.107806 type:complete len:206 (+) Transcript_44692:548-1165(+)